MEEINENLHIELLNFDKEKREKWISERKPFSVLFELTSRCNFNCIHCYLQNCHISQQLPFAEIKEILDILFENGILFLTFTGGEVFSRTDFLDIYIYAKKRGFFVEIFTNGYLINDNAINLFKEYPPLLVDVSLYGACEETYSRVTGVSGAFEKVIENCKKMQEAGVRVSLKTPVIKPTYEDLRAMRDLADSLGIQFVYTFEISPTIDRDTSPVDQQVPLRTILKHEFQNYYDQVQDGTRALGEKNHEEIEALKKNPCVYACNVALNSFVIDYKGNMCPCMKLRHKGEKLTKDNYSVLWDKFSIFSKKIASRNYKCLACPSRYYCDVCPAEMDLIYGDEEYRDNDLCKPAKIRRLFYENNISVSDALKGV